MEAFWYVEAIKGIRAREEKTSQDWGRGNMHEDEGREIDAVNGRSGNFSGAAGSVDMAQRGKGGR